MYTRTFKVTPIYAYPFLGPFEMGKVEQWLNTAVAFTVISETDDPDGYSKIFTISGPVKELVDKNLQDLQDAMVGQITLFDVASEATKEAIGEASQIVGESAGKILKPILPTLNIALIVLGIAGIAFLAYKFKGA